jgi:hypothetical protein
MWDMLQNNIANAHVAVRQVAASSRKLVKDTPQAENALGWESRSTVWAPNQLGFSRPQLAQAPQARQKAVGRAGGLDIPISTLTPLLLQTLGNSFKHEVPLVNSTCLAGTCMQGPGVSHYSSPMYCLWPEAAAKPV